MQTKKEPIIEFNNFGFQYRAQAKPTLYDINLTKIQSLPIIGHEWEYLFYVDVTYDNITRYRQSIDAITPLVRNIKILGEYQEAES